LQRDDGPLLELAGTIYSSVALAFKHKPDRGAGLSMATGSLGERAARSVFEQSLRAPWSVFQWRRSPFTGGVDERTVPPSHDCQVCNIELPLKI
jgi:hypothetical protein